MTYPPGAWPAARPPNPTPASEPNNHPTDHAHRPTTPPDPATTTRPPNQTTPKHTPPPHQRLVSNAHPRNEDAILNVRMPSFEGFGVEYEYSALADPPLSPIAEDSTTWSASRRTQNNLKGVPCIFRRSPSSSEALPRLFRRVERRLRNSIASVSEHTRRSSS
jgi:hypothetical protein